MSVLRDYASAVLQPTLPFDTSRELRTPTRYDEVVDSDGSLRPAWRNLASLALALTPDALNRVDGEITRFLADSGVTYIRPDVGAEPWQLDPMPLVLDSAGWATLDVGLAQRAELLNALLVDVYGEQTLLSSGTIPASVVFGHSGFARPVARVNGQEAHPLLLTGADLGRDENGEWHVLADRVQAPSGLGFTMQNRRAIAQVLPDLFHQNDLHRVEPYLAALRAALAGVSPEIASPRIVVLTPGTLSETAFDQAFLANSLGFPLVQGSDLVVHDGYVWMKPAGWPITAPSERVDVIVRRVDAEFCDPLELRSDSRLGVAGLSEAVRRGRVHLVNGLGAGVLENPGLLPFLPAACEHLLGERLRIPSVPTAWCGDEESRRTVVARLADGDPDLIVRTIDQPRKAVAGMSVDELTARIEAEPYRFVGQDKLPLSQAPVWNAADGTTSPTPLVFRAFTLRFGSSYRPLVGGLATVREHPDAAPRTKDVWVLKGTETEADQGLPEIAPLPFARAIPALAPRAQADMFWAGRYAERAEDLLRLLLTAQQQLDDSEGVKAPYAAVGAKALRQALSRVAGTRYEEPDREFRSLLLDTHRLGSAAHSISRLREALEGVRDQLSIDTWRVFAQFDRARVALQKSSHAHRTAESAGRMLSSTLSLYGVTANMIRDDGWHMIETGRYLERGLQLSRLISTCLLESRPARSEVQVLESVLVAAESVVTHRRRYRGAMHVSDALDLLLLDDRNPRSLAFALAQLRTHLAEMPLSTGSTRSERLLDHLEELVSGIDPAELSVPEGGRRADLAELLQEVTSQLEQLSDSIAQVHFESGPPPVPMSALSLVEEHDV